MAEAETHPFRRAACTGLTGSSPTGRRSRMTSTVTVLAIALLLAMLVIDRLAR
jgi:hypothetical protein